MLDARERLESHGRKIDCFNQTNAALFSREVLEFPMKRVLLLKVDSGLVESLVHRKCSVTG